MTSAMDGGRPGFALTRFEAVDGARVEVEGTWSGVRGVRFVRPALVVHANGAERTLLAVLEHKPWAAEEGRPWFAAFPWDGGELDAAQTELAVAPSIVVPLGGPAAPAIEPDPHVALRARAAEAQERARRLEAEVALLRREREHEQRTAPELARREAAAAAEREQAAKDAGRRSALAERDAAVAARQAVVAERDAARAERDDALAARDGALAQRDALARELGERDQAADGAARRREQVLTERDEARRERERAERRAGEREEEGAERERLRAAVRIEEVEGALAAAEAERDRALAEPAGVAAPVPVARVPRAHAAQSTRADWTVRAVALFSLLVLLILAITLLRAIG
jgi:hypothetical protein